MHILDRHGSEEELGMYDEQEILELVQAGTSVGQHWGYQGDGTGRPIYGLFFYGRPLAVAISVGSNGYVVGMNRQSYELLKQQNNISDRKLSFLASWPVADPPERRHSFSF